MIVIIKSKSDEVIHLFEIIRRVNQMWQFILFIGTIKSLSDVEAHLFVIMKSKSDMVIYLIGIIVRVNQNKPIHWFEIIKK